MADKKISKWGERLGHMALTAGFAAYAAIAVSFVKSFDDTYSKIVATETAGKSLFNVAVEKADENRDNVLQTEELSDILKSTGIKEPLIEGQNVEFRFTRKPSYVEKFDDSKRIYFNPKDLQNYLDQKHG